MIDWTTRRERARAFIALELKKGRGWASLEYAFDYTVEDAMFLGWYDDNPKHTPADKIAGAIAAYVLRFGVRPTVVLVNEHEMAQVAGVDVRTEPYIRRHNVWVGMVQA